MPFALFPSQEQLEEKGLFFRNCATTLYSSHLIKWTQYLSAFLLASIAFLEMQLPAASMCVN